VAVSIGSLTLACVFFALAGVAAVLNWIAVEREDKRLEYIAKPATTALLLAAAITLTPYSSAERGWFVAALAFCLAGDVFLMLPRDAFVPGLASFLVGHLCFLAGLVARGLEAASAVPTVVIALVVIPLVARPILRGARNRDSKLVPPVVVYVATLGSLLAVSAGTRSGWTVAGAAVFALSDTILARNKFVRPVPHGHLATMVTYHAALALLVVSLV